MQALTQIATDEFLSLPFLQPSEFGDGVNASGVAKRADQLRVTAAVWGARDARINTVSPGIIFTPMSLTDLAGPSGASMCSTIQISVIGRLG